MVLLDQLGRMVAAGVPVTEALDLAARNSPPALGGTLGLVKEELQRGRLLSEALAHLLPPASCALVAAAEKTGGLPAALSALATAAELRLDVRRQVVRAFVLPFVLFSLVFFLPQAHLLFTGSPAAYLRATLVPYMMALAALGAAVWLLPRGMAAALGPARSARLLRMIPVLGGILELSARVRFCRSLAASLEAGLGIGQSLELAGRTVSDPRWQEPLARAARFVAGGDSLHRALERVRLLDGDVLLAVAAGERSGSLPESLEQQARLAQASLTHRVNVSLKLLAVTVLLGTYAFVAVKIVNEFTSILGGSSQQMQEIIKELDGAGGGAGAGDLLKQLQKETGGKADIPVDDLLQRALDPAGVKQLPPDIRKHLE